MTSCFSRLSLSFYTPFLHVLFFFFHSVKTNCDLTFFIETTTLPLQVAMVWSLHFSKWHSRQIFPMDNITSPSFGLQHIVTVSDDEEISSKSTSDRLIILGRIQLYLWQRFNHGRDQ